MPRFSEQANVDKIGIIRLEEMGAYAVIANKTLVVTGKAGKFAVVNVSEEWVDSVHSTHDEALSSAQQLFKQ